jgi:hypothetical protein
MGNYRVSGSGERLDRKPSLMRWLIRLTRLYCPYDKSF